MSNAVAVLETLLYFCTSPCDEALPVFSGASHITKRKKREPRDTNRSKYQGHSAGQQCSSLQHLHRQYQSNKASQHTVLRGEVCCCFHSAPPCSSSELCMQPSAGNQAGSSSFCG